MMVLQHDLPRPSCVAIIESVKPATRGVKSPTAARTAAPSPGTAGHAMLIFRLARSTGYQLGRALESLGMRTHEFAVLHHLHYAGPLSQQELGGALRINPSNL